MKKISSAVATIAALLALAMPANAKDETKSEMTTASQPINIKIASYNILHGAKVNCDYAVLAKDIAEVDPDIIGLQEVDMKTTRIGGVDAVEIMAKKAGYKYYRFSKSINLKGGGYGTAILSKFPIEEYQTVALESGKHEKRSVGHAVLRVRGKRLDFFNTHLSYESTKVRAGQFAAIADMTAKCERYVVTGDFNTSDFAEFAVFKGATLANNAQHSLPTFPESSMPIDNIVLSKGFELISTDIRKNDHSDHYLFYARTKLNE